MLNYKKKYLKYKLKLQKLNTKQKAGSNSTMPNSLKEHPIVLDFKNFIKDEKRIGKWFKKTYYQSTNIDNEITTKPINLYEFIHNHWFSKDVISYFEPNADKFLYKPLIDYFNSIEENAFEYRDYFYGNFIRRNMKHLIKNFDIYIKYKVVGPKGWLHGNSNFIVFGINNEGIMYDDPEGYTHVEESKY